MTSAVAETSRQGMDSSAATTRMALVVEYDGTGYAGSQLQADRPTVQQALEEALRSLTGEAVRIALAGRTDAGVHALGQVASFRTATALPPRAFVSGLNHYLPDDIAVKAARIVGGSFDPRRGACSREYVYTILNSDTRSPLHLRFAHRVPGALDVRAMDEACGCLIGAHDFASFASDIAGESGSTVRRVYRASVRRRGDLVRFDIQANAFVRHQIRNTAGCLVRIGLGRMCRDELEQIIEARRPGLAGPALPARGLCLVRVSYPPAVEHPQPLEEQTK